MEDGLRARSTRGDIGTSWWSRRFLDVLESFAIGGRLARGKTYARKGQVMSLEILAGRVTARVQGSRAKPYDVTIVFAPLADTEWERVEAALSEQALSCAKLLAGEVPAELEAIFADSGSPLFPTAVDDLQQVCSCPDWGVPCKHLAATFYLLGEAFDSDPFLILRWRGREREELLRRLRVLRSGEDADEHHQRTPMPTAGTRSVLAGLSWPGDRSERFWQPPPPLPARPPVLTAPSDVVLRQLPEPESELGGPELVSQLRRVYRSEA
ncbi:MAG TPA: SWIM zinc finger family protein [Microlunatus sp.]